MSRAACPGTHWTVRFHPRTLHILQNPSNAPDNIRSSGRMRPNAVSASISPGHDTTEEEQPYPQCARTAGPRFALQQARHGAPPRHMDPSPSWLAVHLKAKRFGHVVLKRISSLLLVFFGPGHYFATLSQKRFPTPPGLSHEAFKTMQQQLHISAPCQLPLKCGVPGRKHTPKPMITSKSNRGHRQGFIILVSSPTCDVNFKHQAATIKGSL